MKDSTPRLLVSLFLVYLVSCAILLPAPVHAADFSFPALDVRNEWPKADFWKQISLPPALGSASVSNVKISSKNSIFPLKAKNGIMFSGNVDDKEFDTICNTLWKSGYSGVTIENEKIVNTEDKSLILIKDIDRIFYRSYYIHNGELMHIELNKSSRGKLNFTIRYLPDL